MSTPKIVLRDYQIDGKRKILHAWESGVHNVLYMLPTGAGKTAIASEIIEENRGPVCAIAHRQELVAQISQALGRSGVVHRIIGPMTVIRDVVRNHEAEFRRSFYDPNAAVGVAGVDTLVRRVGQLKTWGESVTMWFQDEAHHLLRENKWGAAVEMFPNARGLGVTATPERADGKGLGRQSDGVMDSLIIGPSMRSLITRGYLTDYTIFSPKSDLDLSDVSTGKTGDWSRPGLTRAVQRSHIIGDVVECYRRFAPGKLGITFATDVKSATEIADQFNACGVPAAIVSAKTPAAERSDTLRRFRNREILQIVNVDLFGEGFDLPALEVVSMARPTKSYPLFCQQFGRALRPMPGKGRAIIIDHVGNVAPLRNYTGNAPPPRGHGLPDAVRYWSLAARKNGAKRDPGEIPLTPCPNCSRVYERILRTCPYCGYYPEPIARNGPEFVDGDLEELDAETLAMMRGDVAGVDLTDSEFVRRFPSTDPNAIGGAAKSHRLRREAQRQLRDAIAWWAGHQKAAGRTDSESYRKFYFTFGVDVLSAQALGRIQAEELTRRVQDETP